MSKLDAAYKLFDEYNRKDPRVFEWAGETYPQEYFFAIKLYEWVLKLNPDAGEELLLASRSQHIGRWEMPRDSYLEGRDSYLKWRKELALHHASIATRLMQQVGYADVQVKRVSEILLKKRIKTDADVQTMENALCLVFLEFQYEEFRKKHEDDLPKVVNILWKSLLKMDAHGHQFALSLPYSEAGLNAVIAAMQKLN
ncbi:DUF4202 domain-containing protein [Mucilaginibacter sp. PAMB04168]|uniref:DUF4202 domain-containing protein n=1 Tax=Mucilaginibacter sp. PAMB04168 TaxID=3138567 RepID=UPI0031F6A714